MNTPPYPVANLCTNTFLVGSEADFFPFTEVSTSCLGRAFLQGAFTGTNWQQNVSWLAQAPGPGASGEGLGFDPVDLLPSETTLDVQTGEDDFKNSWKEYWTPNPAKSHRTSGTGHEAPKESSGSNGLSGGAIAGIVVGIVAFIAIVAAVLFVLSRKRRKQLPTSQSALAAKESPQEVGELESPTLPHEAAGPDRGELSAGVPKELYGTHAPPRELPADHPTS